MLLAAALSSTANLRFIIIYNIHFIGVFFYYTTLYFFNYDGPVGMFCEHSIQQMEALKKIEDKGERDSLFFDLVMKFCL
ncbi:MAG: hypothetical protein ABJZ62_07785, partial [Hyphomicrobiales bacterium]